MFNQTMKICKLGSKIFLQHPSLLFYPLFSFLLCFLLEAIVLFFIYFRYGIHIFNHETLELWGFLSLWELGFLFAVFIAPLSCFVTFFMLLAKAALADALTTLYEDQLHFSWYQSFCRAVFSYRELMQYAYLKTLLVIVGESGIKKFLRRHVDLLGGRDYIYQARADNWLEATFLVVPLLVLNRLSLRKAIEKSRIVMEELFGGKVMARFSFVMLIFFLALCFASPLAHLIGAKTNGMAGIALFFLFLALIMCIIRSLEGIFHLIVYRYCLKKSIEPFTRDAIVTSFAHDMHEIL